MNNFQIITGIFGFFTAIVFASGIVMKDPRVTAFAIIVGVMTLVFATSADVPQIGIVGSKTACYQTGAKTRSNDTDVVSPARMRANGCMELRQNGSAPLLQSVQ